MEHGEEIDVVRRSGNWYSYGENRLGQGRERARDYLVSHPEEMQAIEKKILEHHGHLVRKEKQAA